MVIVLLNLALIEALSFTVTRLVLGIFSSDGIFLQNIQQRQYEKFLEQSYDPVAGWKPSENSRTVAPNCIGEPSVYTYDANGARVGASELPAEIIAVGDSFTQGAEVDDEETFPARLQEILQRGVVNYGVGGYGAYQATLRFNRKIDLHPTVRIAVLGIMYENIARVVNSYRPAYHVESQLEYGFKPFLDSTDGTIIEMPSLNVPPVRTVGEVRALAEQAIRDDFWARPEAAFPYTWAVVRTIFGPRSSILAKEKLAAAFGQPRYAAFYRNTDLRTALTFVIKKFVELARDRGIRPMIFFIPRNGQDRVSPDQLIARLRQEDPAIEVFNVGQAEIDWDRFNLNRHICHPSPYGYDAIARYVATKISSEAIAEGIGAIGRQ